MDIEEAKNFARNKIEADTLTQQVRDVVKITGQYKIRTADCGPRTADWV